MRQYDRNTGRPLKTTTFDDQHNGDKLSMLNYDIHTGNVLGLGGKFLVFFASLVAASLPVTGCCI
ncbi:PepSY-associated TM helix domain-containing protein [Pedobacter panaciterrae]|uniref:PepSY-associated TM helix domain-containing protein n=1 Tax=Pedobacter panaciterrae TaxID=363849 RepID=UPI00293BCB26|nr:PepSY-associated TM helix domain-containing protein [Pedobacter panaciterrae]